MHLPYRASQALFYATSATKAAPELPPGAERLLVEPMLQQFRMLSTGDQRHLLRVYHYLLHHGADPDTVTAGLLHDVGKACRKCRITVVDRTLHVVLARSLPGAYKRFARIEEPRGFLLGLHRLANHPARGAKAAELAGYNPRVCNLIRDHDSGGDEEDDQLQLLRQADEYADTTWDTDHLR